jgi:hypothetical protein
MTTQFGQLAAKAATAATSQKPSTKDLTGSDEHRRKFLEAFRRWEILFKRKDNRSVDDEKWLIAEYFDSLKHLSPEGLDHLTKLLKENCTFFPTVRECLDFTKTSGPFDFSSPFAARPELFMATRERGLAQIAARKATLALVDESGGQ